MDWLILILGVPAILIPLALLFGFAGCQLAGLCTGDEDCPGGLVCVQGACVDPGVDQPNPSPSPPENLAAIALDDQSVSLTWTNNDPAATDISFQIEHTPENGEPEVFTAQANLSPTGAASATDIELEEGVTFIYRVRAVLGEERSDFSNRSRATVFPAAPVNLIATPVSINTIELSWTNASAIATEFSLERLDLGEIFRGAGTTHRDPNCVEGTPYEYRVFAIVAADHGGVENNQRQDVRSAASAIVPATIAFTAAFTAPPGTLINEGPNVGFCVVQRLSQTLLAAGGTHQVRILLRGPLTDSLTLDKVTISQAAAPGQGVNLYDPGPDLTEVASGVPPIAANAFVTVGPVNYALDASQDLLIAFDISNTLGQGNVRVGGLTGADGFSRPATAEAGVQPRTPGYPNISPNTLRLIERIEVL